MATNDLQQIQVEVWNTMSNEARMADAGARIRRVLTDIADAKGVPDQWEAFHLHVAITLCGDAMYRAAGVYADKARSAPALREPIDLDSRIPDGNTLRQFKQRLEENLARAPAPREQW